MLRRMLDGFNEYFVTDEGLVYHNNRKLKTTFDKNGYVQIGITVNRKTTTMKVHRLVAKAFIPNPDNFPEVNHIDGNKQNNRVENLEWCTHANNLRHASINRLFRYGENHQNSNLKQNEASRIRELYNVGGLTMNELANMFSTSITTVWRIIHNKTYKELPMENKIFDEFPRVDCSDCSHYWDDSCSGVPQGSEKRCTAFQATKRVDIPQQIKKLDKAFRWLTVSCALIAVAMIVHILAHVIGR